MITTAACLASCSELKKISAQLAQEFNPEIQKNSILLLNYIEHTNTVNCSFGFSLKIW